MKLKIELKKVGFVKKKIKENRIVQNGETF